jgi:hypothetical protein
MTGTQRARRLTDNPDIRARHPADDLQRTDCVECRHFVEYKKRLSMTLS